VSRWPEPECQWLIGTEHGGNVMKVSSGHLFQNASSASESNSPNDVALCSSASFRDELRLGVLAAELGFAALWVVEHHFSPHGETPSPLQELAYFAGRCPNVDLGTCVLVLPWNDPVRLAEQIAVLDNMIAPERTLTLGLGRGAAQSEFDGFEVKLSESTARFRENAELVEQLLCGERVTYVGDFRNITGLTILPRPFRPAASIKESLYCAWGSSTSLEFAAHAGLRPLFNPTGDPAKFREQLTAYNNIRAQHGWDPLRPIISMVVYSDTDPQAAAEDGLRYLRAWSEIQLQHYQLLDADHFRAAGNYPDYVRRAEAAAAMKREEVIDSFALNQIYGSPDQCLEKIRAFYEAVDPIEVVLVTRFGGMDFEVAERNIRLVAGSILPEVKSWPSLSQSPS
jgi:alkanesulfonate monooxygenase SsuD/methylene tetrahydromethanopterin reductase-like flavin-dependent oxidoreductase (luciferase family)